MPFFEIHYLMGQFNTVTAGYETTSATLFYSVINLALHPAWQRQMQDDIDRIYCGGDLTKWAYTGGVDQLYKSSIDAVVRESKNSSLSTATNRN